MQNFTADDLHRTTVYDRDGQKVGNVQQVYLDDDSGRPSWVTVNTGLFGTNESLIPLDGAHIKDDVLQVPFDKQVIKDAPNFDPGHHMDQSDEDALYDYYGVGSGQAHDNRADLDRGDRTDDDHDRGDRTVADRVMDRPGEDRGLHDRETHDEDRDIGTRGDLQDRSAEATQGRGGARTGQAGDAFTQGHDTRAEAVDQSGLSDSDRDGDDLDRDLLERERELLQRERELLDRERQLMEREAQRGARPRLRRHDPGQR